MHTVEEKPKLILRIKRIKGQIAAIERALEADEECSDLLQLITGARGAMNGLMAELLEGHIRFHVIDPKQKISSEQALAADELIDIVRSYLKNRLLAACGAARIGLNASVWCRKNIPKKKRTARSPPRPS